MAGDVLLAVVLGAHGVKGDVRLKVFSETPARYPLLHARDGRVFHLAKLKPAKSGEAVASFADVVDRATADGLKGLELYVPRAELPATDRNEFYHADLIGLAAEDEAGRAIGKVRAIHNFGAGDVIEIERGRDDTLMLPFARDFVPVVDLAGNRLVIAVPEDTGEDHIE